MGRYFLFFPAQKNGQNHCPSNFHDRGKEYKRYSSIKLKFDHQYFVFYLICTSYEPEIVLPVLQIKTKIVSILA